MTNPTSNFGWQMPTPTDLVTDLPADFEVFGQAVDTDFADLLGGTTGQILSKASATDLDFTWITNDVGDITNIAVTSPITGGGSSGSVTIGVNAASTSASGAVQLSDSTSTTSSVLASTPTATKAAYDLANSAYAPAFTNNFYAGKNKLINGDFGIWQRGTSGFALGSTYNADRWVFYTGTATNKAVTQQTFTPGTAPVSGYEGTYFWRFAESVATVADTNNLAQRIEDVRIFAGQTVTMSYWAKSSTASSTSTLRLSQNFGSGGSTAVNTTSATVNLTTSWARYSQTLTLPSITGKTIGTSSYLAAQFIFSTNLIQTIDIWGVQVEAGSVATPFQTASGSIAGELALCQRYYWRANAGSLFQSFGSGQATSTTQAYVNVQNPVTMRTAPNSVDFSTLAMLNAGGAQQTVTGLALSFAGSYASMIQTTVGVSLIAGNASLLVANNSTSAYLGFSAEL